MQINGSANSPFHSVRAPAENRPNMSSAMAALQRQRSQLQEEITKVKEGDYSKQVKEDKIKMLQEELQKVETQMMEERRKQLTEPPKKEQKEEAPKSEEELNPPAALNSKVMTGLVSAAHHLQTGQTAMGVYEKAKARNDESGMKRAMSYAAPEMKKAFKSSIQVQKGLEEYRKQMQQTAAKKEAEAAQVELDHPELEKPEQAHMGNISISMIEQTGKDQEKTEQEKIEQKKTEK